MEKHLKDKLSKTLFHGTLKNRADNIIENGIDFAKLNDIADFGKGFYLTDSYALAQDTAITRFIQEIQLIGKDNASIPVVMRIKIKQSNSLRSKYSVKEFYGESIEWKKFICANRWKEVLTADENLIHNQDLKYDIVIGLTADGKMPIMKKILKQDNFFITDDILGKLRPYITRYSKMIGNKIKHFTTKAYQISLHNQDLIKTCVVYKDYDIIRLKKEDGYDE